MRRCARIRVLPAHPMTTSRLTDALQQLSPSDRALLELALRHDVPPAELATLTHGEPESIERRLDEVAGWVAERVGLRGEAPLDELKGWLAGFGAPVTARPEATEAPAPPAEPAEPAEVQPPAAVEEPG